MAQQTRFNSLVRKLDDLSNFYIPETLCLVLSVDWSSGLGVYKYFSIYTFGIHPLHRFRFFSTFLISINGC